MFRAIICTTVFLLTAHTVADDYPAVDYSPSAVFNDPDTPTDGTPQVVIDAPDSVFIGEMIVIDLSGSKGSGFDLRIIPEPPVVRVFNDGQIITAATGAFPTEYLFIFSCAVGDKSDIQTRVIRVERARPVDPVDPVEPNGLLAKVLSWCDAVESPTARDDALKLQQSFSTLAKVIESGTFSDVPQIMDATKQSNDDALGANKEYWVPFLDNLTEELRTMFDTGRLPTIESHAKVWATVSHGLRQFANRGEGQ